MGAKLGGLGLQGLYLDVRPFEQDTQVWHVDCLVSEPDFPLEAGGDASKQSPYLGPHYHIETAGEPVKSAKYRENSWLPWLSAVRRRWTFRR